LLIAKMLAIGGPGTVDAIRWNSFEHFAASLPTPCKLSA
jgi:hypothetical protein